ncbi:hypothetical protein HAX54_016617 [Datura stramonium]|uniref:Uncharacterized protein n=1 Tax=Datura stramonium TaxID=4076 RepID=A0ABS8UM34_DATST|nr:hypothetical protein [Datura stramonium]
MMTEVHDAGRPPVLVDGDPQREAPHYPGDADDDNDDAGADKTDHHLPDAKSSSEALFNFKARYLHLQLKDRSTEVLGSIHKPVVMDSLLPLPFPADLSFMYNSFKGAMPDWKKLGALKSLYLSNNTFSGQIPIEYLQGLFEVEARNNKFSGSIPSFPKDVLKLLNVSNNQLEGTKASVGSLWNQLATPKSRNQIVVLLTVSTLRSVANHGDIIKVALSPNRSSSQSNPQLTSRAVGSNNNEDQNTFTSSAPDHVTMSSNPAYARHDNNINNNKAVEAAPAAADLLRASARCGSGNLGSSYKALLMDGQAVVVKRKEEKLLVYDYASNGSLASHLHGKHSGLDWPSRLKIIKGLQGVGLPSQ